MLTVNVIVRADSAPPGVSRHLELALDTAYRALGSPAGSDGEVTVLLTGVDEISELHETYFDDPSPTDVITFPSGGEGFDEGAYLGDIAICVDVASEQAREAGHSEIREIAFLALHGLLHLLGWSDDTARQRRSMLDEQERLLRLYESEVGACL